ncbi:hypothetical protein BH11ACT2_BH11ACT2_13670 [soil metagenome]
MIRPIARRITVPITVPITVLITAGVTALGLLLSGCSASAPSAGPDVAALAAKLPQESVKTPDMTRLAKGLTPPTNAWFSGLVFGAQPKPVFPLPLSFGLTGSGFTFGVPVVTTAPGAIAAPNRPDVTIDTGADRHTVTAYDDVSVTTTESVAGRDIGRVTIARGSPVVSLVADASRDIHLSASFARHGSVLVTSVGGRQYGLVTTGTLHGGVLHLNTGETANWFAVPRDGSATALAEYAAHGIEKVRTSWQSTTTTLDYSTRGGDVLIGTLPHQRAKLGAPASCDLGSFETTYGRMDLCSGSRLSWSVDAVKPASSLDLGSVSAADRKELRAQLGKDIAATPALPGDTYYGGKALARLATLLQLARELGDTGSASTLQKTLATELTTWASPCAGRSEKCFVYDPKVHGIVGHAASFGSDEFNDHHFHYGYFLFAAGVAAQDDAGLEKKLAPTMTLLAADIGSATASTGFPALRNFDPYSGHSWASGYSPFADGNNQESSSEAIAAWNGLATWARTAKNEPLASEATWLLSSEAASAMDYWLDFDEKAKPYVGYDRSVVGIVWDGKRDYGTWFSAEPSAILGIQLLPMGAYADYLARDPARIRASVKEAGQPKQFADYLLMYSALAGKTDAAAALTKARALPEAQLDPGNSRTYLLAWIMAHGG